MSSLTPTPTLKPMNAGDVLDNAIRIFRQNFIPLVTIVGIINLPIILFQVILAAVTLPLSASGINPNSFEDIGPGIVIFYIATIVLGLISAVLVIFQQGAIA